MNLTKLLTGGNGTVASIVWPLMCGVFLALIIVYINKNTVGKLVKALLSAKANTKETAKSLDELGLAKKRYLVYALRSGSTLSTLVRKAPDAQGEVARFYLPEEVCFRAETFYKDDRFSPMTIVIGTIAFLALTLLLLNVIPELLQMTSNAIDGFKNL